MTARAHLYTTTGDRSYTFSAPDTYDLMTSDTVSGLVTALRESSLFTQSVSGAVLYGGSPPILAYAAATLSLDTALSALSIQVGIGLGGALITGSPVQATLTAAGGTQSVTVSMPVLLTSGDSLAMMAAAESASAVTIRDVSLSAVEISKSVTANLGSGYEGSGFQFGGLP